MAAQPCPAGTATAAGAQANNASNRTTSKTVTDTLVGEHTHTIVGYSLIKGLGDGEPVASERFTVGGHEWVLLFYPDGKRSSSSEQHGGGGADAGNLMIPVPPPAGAVAPPPPNAAPRPPGMGEEGDGPGPQPNGVAAAPVGNALAVHPGHQMGHHAHVLAMRQQQPLQQQQMQQRRDTTNEYAALFVALIGEGPNPQGIVNTSEGKVVRAFHRFTLVDQTGQGRDLTKGRTRDAGAVKISCARQDPNARNCHGYRKFVKRTILEDPSRGYLLNDTIVIKYTIELVVSSGGALTRSGGTNQSKADLIKVPPPTLGADMGALLASGQGTDWTFVVEGEEMKVHKMILEARSPVFRAMLNSSMREGQEGRCNIMETKAPVFRALLHFVYTDQLPEELDGPLLDVAMAQHLLVGADQYELVRLRRICERRLCETVDVETVATTLTLAEQNHAEELKKVCLDFVSRNLRQVMETEGYRHMLRSCASLQSEILATIAHTPMPPAIGSGDRHHGERGERGGGAGGAMGAHRSHVRPREQPAPGTDEEQGRRVRQRRD